MGRSAFVMGYLASRPTSQVFSVNVTHSIVCPFKHLKIWAVLESHSHTFGFFDTAALTTSSIPLCFVFFCLLSLEVHVSTKTLSMMSQTRKLRAASHRQRTSTFSCPVLYCVYSTRSFVRIIWGQTVNKLLKFNSRVSFSFNLKVLLIHANNDT